MVDWLVAQRDTAWFARVGMPLDAHDRAGAQAYLRALGCDSQITVQAVCGWREAEAIARDRNFDPRPWQTEQAERERLLHEVSAALGASAALERLTALVELDSVVIHDAAMLAAESHADAHPALIGSASGAAAMAAHEHALAQLAGRGPQHVFMRKYRLFEAGRWPLAVVGASFYLF